jgi:hypothetical protein
MLSSWWQRHRRNLRILFLAEVCLWLAALVLAAIVEAVTGMRSGPVTPLSLAGLALVMVIILGITCAGTLLEYAAVAAVARHLQHTPVLFIVSLAIAWFSVAAFGFLLGFIANFFGARPMGDLWVSAGYGLLGVAAGTIIAAPVWIPIGILQAGLIHRAKFTPGGS